jgi:hypothetical protein
MSWLNLLKQPGHVNEAVIHFNEAKDRMAQGARRTEVARSLLDALNKIQTEWVLHAADDAMGEVKAFETMILDGTVNLSENRWKRLPLVAVSMRAYPTCGGGISEFILKLTIPSDGCPYRKSHPSSKSLHLELRLKIRCSGLSWNSGVVSRQKRLLQ